jgi:ubiquinone/menaquinone biosynthesis C-methylase UbiE
MASSEVDHEVREALLTCSQGHWFPVVRGIPRMLPDSLQEHWATVEPLLSRLPPDRAESVRGGISPDAGAYDRRTKENFSLEWDFHEVGDATWGIELDERVRKYLLDPIGVPRAELPGKVLLDAGCGNGSQSVAYTELGLEVIALDLSSGLEHGLKFLERRPDADPKLVHFVQGDLQHPPLADGCVDIIHSAGVLHHTPDTLGTFRRLCRVLKPGGTFYIWLYKREEGVTTVVDSLRKVTTRMRPATFARVAQVMAPPFQAFRYVANAVKWRAYPPTTRRESALALMDIFGAPHAHAHSFPEVTAWYEQEGFTTVWPCNDDRRGFGACGRLPAHEDASRPFAVVSTPLPGQRENDRQD